MQFFLSLYQIGLNNILNFSNSVLSFLSTPVIEILTFSFIPGGVKGSFVFQSLVRVLVTVLRAIGFNLESALYVFILENIGFLLAFLIIIKLIDLIN